MHQTTINTCRIIASPRDSEQLKNWIRRQESRVPGLPPAAILLIKHAQLEMQIEQSDMFTHKHFQQRITAQLASAVQPHRGSIPAHAKAIVFRNYSELLACLASALVGQQQQTWWYRTLLQKGHEPGMENLATKWLQHPQAVPAAMCHLADWGKLSALVQMLSRQVSQKVLYTMLEHFRATRFLQAIDWQAAYETTETGAQPEQLYMALQYFWQPLLKNYTLDRRWSMWQTWCATVGIILAHEPVRVQTQVFAQAFQRHQQRVIQILANPQNELIEESTSISNSKEPSQWQAVNNGKPRVRTVEHAARNGIATDTRHGASSILPIEQHRHAQQNIPMDHGSSILLEQALNAKPLDTSVQQDDSQKNGKVAFIDTRENQAYDLHIETQIGGVFFLLPILRRLNVFVTEDPPFKCLFSLAPWERLAVIAQAVLLEPFYEFSRDPLWRVFALLDGYDPEREAGIDFHGSAPYHLPESWLAGVDDAKCFVAVAGDTLHDWQRFMRDHLNDILKRQLAGNWDECSALVHHVFVQPAQIFISGPHVDCVFPIDASDISIRKAGLDCNPGWISELGKVITFYYR
ncbi:MAG: hypothetical protein DWQ10_14435 [Calditrichaeota bacterium]|nr:MAG: hypothetical protein DWQ10_14435 [Calditrichota bacterium]